MDLLDAASVQRMILTYHPDSVISCAAYGVDHREQDAGLATAVNIKGAYALLETCASHSVERYVHIGSCFEYGDKDYTISEEDSLEPTTIYGATKAAGSILVRQRAKELAINSVVLRPFGMWGPFEAG